MSQFTGNLALRSSLARESPPPEGISLSSAQRTTDPGGGVGLMEFGVDSMNLRAALKRV